MERTPFFLAGQLASSRTPFKLGLVLEWILTCLEVFKVESVISDNSWVWARRRNAVIREIMESIPSSLVPNCAQNDSVVWSLTATGDYSLKSAWQALRNRMPVVSYNVVWIKRILFPAGLSFNGWPYVRFLDLA